MFFILFLYYVTVGLAALQFNSPSVTLLNHYPHLFYVQFLLTTSSAHTIYSFTHWFYQWRGTHVFDDPFPNTRKATKVARETSAFCFVLFVCLFVYKGRTAFFEKRGSVVRNTPVDRGSITANPGLNFNSSFFFFYSKAFSRIIFSIIFRASNHQIVDRQNWTEFPF